MAWGSTNPVSNSVALYPVAGSKTTMSSLQLSVQYIFSLIQSQANPSDVKVSYHEIVPVQLTLFCILANHKKYH